MTSQIETLTERACLQLNLH